MKKMLAVFIVAMLLAGTFVIVGTEAGRNVSVRINDLAASPWPLFRGDLNRTGQSTYSTEKNFGEFLWRFKTGGAVDSSPAIGPDGTIYFGSDDKYFYAIHPNGTLKWRYNTGYSVKSSPAVGDNAVYVGSGPYLYSFSFEGHRNWRFKAAGYIPSSPAITSDGTIYFLDDDSVLYAINADGSLKWSHRFFTDNPNPSESSPAVASDGTIYVGLPDPYDNGGEDYKGHLFALDPSGSVLWDYYIDYGEVLTTPAIGPDGTIYFQTFGGIMGYNYIVAIDKDGNELWSYELLCDDMIYGYEGSSPTISPNGGVYVNSGDTLFFADSEGVNEVHDFTGYTVLSSPSLSSDDTLWFGCENGTIYGYDISENKMKTEYHTNASYIASSPAIDKDGTLYIGTGDGYLYALGDASIYIYNDTDFEEKARKYRWRGNGSEDNPYIIENKNIYLNKDNEPEREVIHIENTRSHFIIRNCSLMTHNSNHMVIYLYNVTNGTIENNTMAYGDKGISLLNCYSNNIKNNFISSNRHVGIYLYRSYSNSIYNNFINSSEYGIHLYEESHSNVLKNNNISFGGTGIVIFYYSNDNIIENNTLYMNDNYGIDIQTTELGKLISTNNRITGNSFKYNAGSGNTYDSSHVQAKDRSGSNYWNWNGKGNYWMDWAENNNTNDMNKDGIVDWGYRIDGGKGEKDEYPLKHPFDYKDTSPPTFRGIQNITNIGDGKSLRLSWSAADDGSNPITYYVYRSTSPGEEDFNAPVGNTTDTYYVDSGLTEGTTYYYVVRAMDASGNEENNTVEKSGTPEIEWYLQVESSDIEGFMSLTDLSVNSLGNGSVEWTSEINSPGDYILGNASWLSEPFENDTDIGGNWTFEIYGHLTGKDIADGNLYAKVYRYSNTSRDLLFQAYDDENIASYNFSHLFSWTYDAASAKVKAGERIYVEIWVNISSVYGVEEKTYDYSGITQNGTYEAYYCDVDVYPPAGDNLNSKEELDDEDYEAIGSSDGSYYSSPNPGVGDKVFMWFEMDIDEDPDEIEQMNFTFKGHPSKDGALYIYLYNFSSSSWNTDELAVKDFSTKDSVIKGVLNSGFRHYMNASGRVRWGIYSETSNSSLYTDYVSLEVLSNRYGRFVIEYDSYDRASSVHPTLGYGGPMLNITVHSGWNLITLPWQTESVSIKDALSGYSWDKAMVYVNGNWYTYNKNRDTKYNLGFPEVNNRMGIWVNFTSDGVLSGPNIDIGNTSITLHKGWNLVGYPTELDRKVSDALSGIPWKHIETSDANGNIYALSSGDYMVAGKAYWIYVEEGCVWTVRW